MGLFIGDRARTPRGDMLRSTRTVGGERDSGLLTTGQPSFPSCSVKVQAREMFMPGQTHIASSLALISTTLVQMPSGATCLHSSKS